MGGSNRGPSTGSFGNHGAGGLGHNGTHHGGNWNHGGNGNWSHHAGNNWNHHHGNWNGGWNNNWGWGRNHGWYGYGHRGYYGGYYPYGLLSWGFGFPYWGWGLGYGWGGGYGYGYPYYSSYGYGYPVSTTYVYADTGDAGNAPVDSTPTADQLANAGEFVALGEQAFRSGQYEAALRDWQHAMVDDPNNGAVVLLMGQAMFQLGQYDAAANAIQMAMQMLPEEEWGNVVKNYTQLYGNIEDYTNQVRVAEKSRDSNPDDGAIRFLLGYHFGYLNYPKQAVRELDKALDIEPRDVGAQKLRDIFAKQAGIPARAPAAIQPPQPQQNKVGPPAVAPQAKPANAAKPTGIEA